MTSTRERITLQVTFHSAFRVGAATPQQGVDQAVNMRDPLPGEHLKGLIRDQADLLVQLGYAPADLVEAAFGSPDVQSPWTFTSARPTEPWQRRVRHRVSIDADTGAALKDHLLAGEQVWAPGARAAIVQIGNFRDVAIRNDHAALLRSAARMVKAIGQTRRRGLGWISLACDDTTSDDDLTRLRAALTTGGRS